MIRQILGRWASLPVIEAFIVLCNEIVILFQHWVGIVKVRSFIDKNSLKLNVGCGGNLKPGWINIDLFPRTGIPLDMRRPMPFRNNSCVIIYAEHFLEHLSHNDGKNFLAESYRVLESSGVLSLSVPDLALTVKEYLAGDIDAEILNREFRYDGAHKFMYDYKILERYLYNTGFRSVSKRVFRAELDHPDRKHGSLFVEAVK